MPRWDAGGKGRPESGLTATSCLQDKTWGGSIVRSTVMAVSQGMGVYSQPIWPDGTWCLLESGVAVGRLHVSRKV